MTRWRNWLPLAALLFFLAFPGQAQNSKRKMPPTYMYYTVQDGDTVYLDTITPAWIFPRGSRVNRTDWRKYCRLVYNFNKVYPYALLGKKLSEEVDLNIATQQMRRRQRDKYINDVQWQLLHDFEDAIRHMTISQGQLLVKLVDREMGKTPYAVVKDYKSRVAAGFWQGVAKLFDQDLKTRYDPEGADKQTEQLVQMWEKGEFDLFYYSIFFEWPKKTDIPSQYQ